MNQKDENLEEKKDEIKAEVLESSKKEVTEKVTEQNEQKNIDKQDETKEKEVERKVEKETENETEKVENRITTDEQYKFTQKKINKGKSKKNTYILIAVIVVIVLAIAVLTTIFAILNFNNNTILSGIHIQDVLIEGLTEKEAINVLNEEFERIQKKEILLKINGETYSLTPEQIEVQYGIEKAVEQAYSIGRSGNIFQNNFEILGTMLDEKNITLDITYNEELLINVLEGINAKLPNSMADNTYCVEDDELIITRGVDGLVVDIQVAKQTIIDAIKNGNIYEIEIETKYQKCPEIDIEKIYSEVKSEPQNATYTTNPFEIIPHKNGLDFDLEEAKKIISEPKDEYVIKLEIIEPEIKTNEIGEEAFPDLLSSFSTKYDESNVSRSKNVKIAMSKLNGVVVMPGEVFSYNQTLGKRTEEAGYEYANGFAGGKVVPMLAGGICQVSSTLYDAVLYANLGIVERHNHMFQATYVDPGKDATVVYGSLDFKFENTRNYPIMIKATTKAGVAEIKIFGIREEIEYEVEISTNVLNYTPYRVVYEDDSSLAAGQEKVAQWGTKGCKSITYRIIKLNGKEVSKEVLSTDTYDPLNKIIKRGPVASQETSTVPETSQEETPSENVEENNKQETANTEEPEQNQVEQPKEETQGNNEQTVEQNQTTENQNTQNEQNISNLEEINNNI